MLLLNIPVHGHNCHTLSGGTETFFVKPVYHQYEPYIGQDQTLILTLDEGANSAPKSCSCLSFTI